MSDLSFIEQQFPVSLVSAESQKERKAGAGSSQTLTGVGKWWGRKPLVLVRACLIGLLMPVSGDPRKDRAIFLKIMTMDADGLWRRKHKTIDLETLHKYLTPQEIAEWLCDEQGAPKTRWGAGLSEEQREHVQRLAFERMAYRDQLDYCQRPEQIDGPSEQAWAEINAHLGTNAGTLAALVAELGMRRFGHLPRVGDPVCGGGSIPFEAARLGCKTYASDISPVAALLTWGALHLVGGDRKTRARVREIQQAAFDATQRDIDELKLETNDKGWRHEQLYYVLEVKLPSTGLWVPAATSLVISERYRVCAVIRRNDHKGNYDIDVITGASESQMARAKQGTVKNERVVCPETNQSYSLADLRGDRRIGNEAEFGLRLWEKGDMVPRPDDVLQERLYCIRWAEETAEGLRRHFRSVENDDLEREQCVLEFMRTHLRDWQDCGYVPSTPIPRGGDKTEEPIRTRGWSHWHHLFTPRQLFMLGSFVKNAVEVDPTDRLRVGATALAVGAALERLSKLCGVDPHVSKGPGSTVNAFFNQALNPQYTFGSRRLSGIRECLCGDLTEAPIADSAASVIVVDARGVATESDIWFTDPPYADAINYHELSGYFLSWYQRLLSTAFPDWHMRDLSALSVRGAGDTFKKSMVEIYTRLTERMPANGLQLVQFTHQDPSVWGDLGMILWASGLCVTAAWTVSTETPAGGLKKGNYVQGTVNLVLRKRQGQQSAWLDEIYPLIEDEVKQQLDSMIAIDDESAPNFGDTDYQLAAYAAALRVLTQFSDIEGMDIRHELFRQRERGEQSEFEKVIARAVEIAANHLIPRGFDEFHWKGLSAPERLYLKGLELERHRELRAGAYQELARGFGVREYTNLYERNEANAVRFKTASEFRRQQLGGTGFAGSLTRHVLYAVHEAVHAESARAGLDYLKTDGGIDYWGKRKAIQALLAYLKPLAHVGHMPHWHADADAATRLAGAIENDH